MTFLVAVSGKNQQFVGSGLLGFTIFGLKDKKYCQRFVSSGSYSLSVCEQRLVSSAVCEYHGLYSAVISDRCYYSAI